MEAVFQCLLRDSVPPECLRLNKAVKAIHWDLGEPPMDEIAGMALESFDLPAEKKEYGINNNLINMKDMAQHLQKGGRTTGHDARIDIFRDQSKPSVGVSPERTSRPSRKSVNEGLRETRADMLIESYRTPPTQVGPKTSGKTERQYGVSVECQDGEVIEADHVIVTSSIGYLTSNPDFFKPQLPLRHQEAIRSMGFGNVAKMCLVWEEREGTGGTGSCGPCEPRDWQRRLTGKAGEGMIPLWLAGARPQLKSAVSSAKLSVRAFFHSLYCFLLYFISFHVSVF